MNKLQYEVLIGISLSLTSIFLFFSFISMAHIKLIFTVLMIVFGMFLIIIKTKYDKLYKKGEKNAKNEKSK